MSDDRGNRPHEERDSTLWLVLGAALIVAGFFFGARSLGVIPWPVQAVLNALVKARAGIGVVLIGVALIIWANGGRRFTAPARGTKLYRSRDNKWVAGVLGGLAEYFNVDVTLLRLAFIALVILLDMGVLIAVYIVMAIVVPLEPEGGAAPYVPVEPTWPTPNTPPPPPIPPAEGEQDRGE
jgi:phage shock protein PspC (stress-responsive transcriptional regulator)